VCQFYEFVSGLSDYENRNLSMGFLKMATRFELYGLPAKITYHLKPSSSLSPQKEKRKKKGRKWLI